MDWLSKDYWDTQYLQTKTGWNIGYASPPLTAYFDQLSSKNLRILIPGAGQGWEVEYLYKNGFSKDYMLDFSEESIRLFKKRCPEFPDDQIICGDFFSHNGQYDLIVEQTFLSSLDPKLRPIYVEKLHELLLPCGKIVGLVFNHEFGFEGPPFGGTEEEYHRL